MASRKPSYRRHRDYIKSFKWTYDLEKDLYECYTKFKLDPRIGYMNRIKQFWDGKHPELNLLTSKNLRGHVSSIIKRKVFTETDFDLQNQNIEQTTSDNSDTAINDNTFVNDIIGSDNLSIIFEQITPEVPNIKESIREQFKINFETTLLANLKDQQIKTKLNENLNKNNIIWVIRNRAPTHSHSLPSTPTHPHPLPPTPIHSHPLPTILDYAQYYYPYNCVLYCAL